MEGMQHSSHPYKTRLQLLCDYLLPKVLGQGDIPTDLPINEMDDLYNQNPRTLLAPDGTMDVLYFFTKRKKEAIMGRKAKMLQAEGHWFWMVPSVLIYGKNKKKIGRMRKLFYQAPEGEEPTGIRWCMEQYSIHDALVDDDRSEQERWVFCKLYIEKSKQAIPQEEKKEESKQAEDELPIDVQSEEAPANLMSERAGETCTSSSYSHGFQDDQTEWFPSAEQFTGYNYAWQDGQALMSDLHDMEPFPDYPSYSNLGITDELESYIEELEGGTQSSATRDGRPSPAHHSPGDQGHRVDQALPSAQLSGTSDPIVPFSVNVQPQQENSNDANNVNPSTDALSYGETRAGEDSTNGPNEGLLKDGEARDDQKTASSSPSGDDC